MHDHDPAHAAHADDMPFSDQEIQELHRQDMQAGTYVVGLMTAIFIAGVLLYTIVAISVAA